MLILREAAVLCLLALLHLKLLTVTGAEPTQDSRDGKFLSIFSLIKFPNSECTDSNGDCGTCLTSGECSSRGGSVSGSCASGFGSCCLVFSDSCGGTISRNRTYIRNPGYSSSYNTAGTCTWTLAKSATNICQIRLDFDESSISQPSNAAGTAGDCSTVDYFRGTPVTGKTTPYICGENAGEHIYLDAGAYSSSEATFSAVLVGTATDRKWKIKVSMIECGSLALPPQGCLQYHTGIAGQVRSFNFVSNSYQHLSNQNYQACIRRETGYCSIGWTKSSDTDSFKLGRPLAGPNTSFNTIFPANEGNSDYVVIPNGSDGGAGQCIATAPPGTTSGPVPSVDYYGGGSLNCNRVTATNAEIISSTVPFTLGVMFNNGEPSTFLNRGFCLNYRQIACDGS